MRPYLVEGSSVWNRACNMDHIRGQHLKRDVVLNKMAIRIVCDKSGKNCSLIFYLVIYCNWVVTWWQWLFYI